MGLNWGPGSGPFSEKGFKKKGYKMNFINFEGGIIFFNSYYI